MLELVLPPDWSRVTVDHVRQACDLYDAGAALPKRPAKSTFLLFSGKSYPAKFIRWLAYRIATGVDLDLSKDLTGGNETARFFANLGLPTSTSATSIALPSRTYEPQKQALLSLLKKRFGTVECEAEFSWLVVPKLNELREPIGTIFQALQAMRGFSDFARPGRALRCDFYIRHERLIIEYDERQHFTLQRATALELYPAHLTLEFDRQEWIATCNSIKATDPSPPYRDEQRAFYDSLRDILAADNGHRLIRFRQGDFDWTCHEAEEKLAAAIHGKSAKNPIEIRKIALVSHDYNVPDSRGLYDYSEHSARIHKLCDDQGCDTILYALYTWDSTSPVVRTHQSIFDQLKHVQRVVLEIGTPPDNFDHVEVWIRDRPQPILAHQRFATSTSPTRDKQRFLDDLPARQLGNGLLVICGETNIASLVRGSDDFYDPFAFADQLRDLKTRVVLNPIHDYMRRYEMREKRRYYAKGGRTVVSVWNQGKGKEAWLPWTVFHDGEEWTDRVQEIEGPFAERPDIRIGVLDLNQQRDSPGSDSRAGLIL